MSGVYEKGLITNKLPVDLDVKEKKRKRQEISFNLKIKQTNERRKKKEIRRPDLSTVRNPIARHPSL